MTFGPQNKYTPRFKRLGYLPAEQLNETNSLLIHTGWKLYTVNTL